MDAFFKIKGKRLLQGQQDDSESKGTCHQTQWPEFNPKTHTVKGGNQLVGVVLWPPHSYHSTYTIKLHFKGNGHGKMLQQIKVLTMNTCSLSLLPQTPQTYVKVEREKQVKHPLTSTQHTCQSMCAQVCTHTHTDTRDTYTHTCTTQ